MRTRRKLRDWVIPCLCFLSFFSSLIILGIWIAHSVESVKVLKIIISITAIASGFASIFSATGDLVDKDVLSYKKGLDKLNTRGWFFAASTVILMFMPILQNLLQDKVDDAKEKVTLEGQNKRDAKLKATYEASVKTIRDSLRTSYEKSSNTTTLLITEILGKYGFSLDSANRQLAKTVRDSSKSNIPVLTVSNLTLLSIEKNKDGINELPQYNYEIIYTSNDAGSSDFNVLCSFVILDSFKTPFYTNLQYKFSRSLRLFDGGSIAHFIHLSTEVHFTLLAVWIRGNCKTLDGKMSLPIDAVYWNNPKSNTWGVLEGITRNSVVNKIQQYEK